MAYNNGANAIKIKEMTEAEKYFKVKLGLQFGKSTLNIIQSFADEQVKKALKGDEGIEYKQGWRDGWDAANEQLKKALDKVEKCKCEMPAKIKGRKMCYRCKKYIE